MTILYFLFDKSYRTIVNQSGIITLRRPEQIDQSRDPNKKNVICTWYKYNFGEWDWQSPNNFNLPPFVQLWLLFFFLNWGFHFLITAWVIEYGVKHLKSWIISILSQRYYYYYIKVEKKLYSFILMNPISHINALDSIQRFVSWINTF